MLGLPCEADVPDPSTFRAFKLNPGDAVIIHLGTWHDFPRALKNPVVVMTMNSEEVCAFDITLGPYASDSVFAALTLCACEFQVSNLMVLCLQVVDALAHAGTARPMDEGDVYKIEMQKAVGRKVEVMIDAPSTA